MYIIETELWKRDTNSTDQYYGFYSTSPSWTRYLYIILVVGALLVFLLLTNFYRMRRGHSPIRGTGWVAPPSYFQSERQSNRNRRQEEVPQPVPLYSEGINTMDAGYFDDNGIFHANPNMSPPELIRMEEPLLRNYEGLQQPQSAAVHDERTHGVVVRDLNNETVPTGVSSTPTGTGPGSGPDTQQDTQSGGFVHSLQQQQHVQVRGQEQEEGSSSLPVVGDESNAHLFNNSTLTSSTETGTTDEESMVYKRPDNPPPHITSYNGKD